MSKLHLVTLVTFSLLFTGNRTFANETQRFVLNSNDQGKQEHRSREGKGFGGEQAKQDQKSPSHQPQVQPQQIRPQVQPQQVQPQVQPRQIQPQIPPQVQPQQVQPQIPPQVQPQQVQPQVQPRQIQPEMQPKQVQPQVQPRQIQPQIPPQAQPRQVQPHQKRNIEQKRDSSDPIKRDSKTEKKDKEFQERKSVLPQWNRSQERDSDQKRSEGSERNAVKTLPNEFRDEDRSRTTRRERIPKERLKEKEIQWQSKSKEWRENFSTYRTRDHIFDNHFWEHFRRRYNHWYFDNNFQWYSGATWPRIVVWLPWQWSQPIYYFYEADGDVYYSTTEDFAYLIPVDSQELFIAQAVRIANTRYPISQQQSDWMPLGIFTFASDNASWNTPRMYISLAISRQGAVSGAYFDAANNVMLEIQGGIDPESQRIAWKFVGSDWPIMESGLYNLTQEVSTLLIHTSSHITETQLLIRLDR